MPATCDHLLWAGPDLGRAVAGMARRTGIRPTFGGHHPDLGTQNAIAALGRRRFLEVIAPDPSLPAGALARRLAALPAPTLLMWAAATPSAAAIAARAEAEGYTSVVVDGHRPRPDGSIVRWTNVFVSGHGAGPLVPFFIEWHDGGHPASDAPSGLRLRSFAAETPQPAALRAVFEALEVRLPVRRGPAARLVALLDTPRGPVELSGP
ncbi:MAG: VOC family protein [bacterium]|nr:VOC family protein [bacterium]